MHCRCSLMRARHIIYVHQRCVICLCAGIAYFEKIFKFPKWESVKQLQLYCGRLDFNHLVSLRKLSFWSKVRNSENRVLSVGVFFAIVTVLML